MVEIHSSHGKLAGGLGTSLIVWHIHHVLCSHGGERCIVINKQEILVNGFHSNTLTIYEFYGCKWHGCPCLGTTSDRAECRYRQTLTIKYKSMAWIQCGFG